MSGLPSMLNGDGIRKKTQVKFAGYDHREGAGDGTLWDMENLWGGRYPLLSLRPSRSLTARTSQPGGLYAHDGLYWAGSGGLYRDGTKLGDLSEGKKVFCSLGSCIVVFPDKAFYRTDTGEFGSLEAEWSGTATLQDGTYAGEAAAANTISTAGAAFPFRAGDAVSLSGCGEENKKTAIIREVSEDGRELRFSENCFSGVPWTGTVTIKREVPDLDFVCQNENRLWGCRGDTIRACKLGDPFNWNVFDGLSTDSWAVDAGSAGDFTGCVSYLGYPVFFKEDHIYKVYGSKPSDFQVMASASLGVEKGSGGSLAVAGERLFYLSRIGVMSYGGGIPECVSEAFGLERYHNGVGGSDGVRYYCSLEGADGCSLFVFDTDTGLWHREDKTRAAGFAFAKGLYCLNEEGELWRLTGEGEGEPEGPVESFAEFGDFTEDSPDKKGFSKVQLRAELEEGAEVTVLLKFDSEEEWRPVRTLRADRKRSFVLPVIPRRCDHWRLRLEGRGNWKLFSLSREFYLGSDV